MDTPPDSVELLRRAPFDVYFIPLDSCHGDVLFSGASGREEDPSSIRLLCVDDVTADSYESGIEVTTIGPRGLVQPRVTDVLDERSYRNEVVNFMARFTSVPQREIPGAVRYDRLNQPQRVTGPSAGSRRHSRSLRMEFVEGSECECITFVDHPQLRMARSQLSDVEVVVLAWNHNEESFSRLARGVAPIKPGTPIFDEFLVLQSTTWQRISTLNQ